MSQSMREPECVLDQHLSDHHVAWHDALTNIHSQEPHWCIMNQTLGAILSTCYGALFNSQTVSNAICLFAACHPILFTFNITRRTGLGNLTLCSMQTATQKSQGMLT